MTGRDLRWRATGVVLAGGSFCVSLLARGNSPVMIVSFLVAIIGIVLMANGKRVAIVWQAERRGHCDTAAAVHAERLRRRRQRQGGERR